MMKLIEQQALQFRILCQLHGLKLSYEDDERDSITSATGSMKAASSVFLSFGDNFRTELDRQKEDFDQYIMTQQALSLGTDQTKEGFGDSQMDDTASCIDPNNYLGVMSGARKDHNSSMICRVYKAKEPESLVIAGQPYGGEFDPRP
ncbi:hypothetical protein LguiA_032758 [Lonicera macranthoides]